ncbi:MAG: hypothetical protein F6K09_03190 [Merismopedia sp. SIO2A8]|nr:hypothetical protein [Merismopedia sp. SIO2A8]
MVQRPYIPINPKTGIPLSLPVDQYGVKIPSSPYPHTQLGYQEGRKKSDRQTRTWGENGQLIKDIDWTDHGRPQNHPNPHEHLWLPTPTGGSAQRGPTKTLELD